VYSVHGTHVVPGMRFLGRVEQGVDDLVDERGDDRRADDQR
jgi:hypothetical protein